MTTSCYCATAPHVTRLTLVLLTSTMLSGVPQAMAQTVLPTGGSVAAGSAAIGTPTNGTLTVTQSSSSAVVNWQSFSVGQGNTVNFVQPSSTSAILNRVTGSATSTIAGQINANGQVYLVNPNGIAITSTGTVNAAGFVASTLGISDSDFMAGKRNFTGNGASASVSNAGTITIGRGGYAALLGGSVDNAGTITVPLGKVGLGSGEQATLDLSGDGFMQVAVPTNAAGTHALVRNSGRISANGGSVQLSAAAARNMARQAINMTGTIEARSVGGRNGAIVLGGSGGAVAVSGKLNVASRKAKGGSITVTGRDIRLAGATLDASGKTGGGNINIGGGRQGQGPLQRAETTTIDSATTIKADATSTGNGGNVVVWSDGATAVYGAISARGGINGGDGGQIETSGHTLDFAGIRIDASAAKGKSGTWLLDPEDLTVDAAAAGTISTTLGGGTNVALQTTAGTASGPGNTSTGNGDIFVNSSIGWSSSAILTLNAYNAIKINAPINVAGAGGVSLIYNTASPTNLSFAQGASIDYGGTNHGGTLSINGQAYTLLYSMADVVSINNGLSGRYALATSLNATGTTYATGVVAGGDSDGNLAATPFSGTFEGLGHTIANLSIDGGSNFYVGLFGSSTGTIRDIGLTGGSVSGTYHVGGLVGYQGSGTISNAYATGAVSGQSYVGGLVGYQYGGTISNAYATGAVSGTYYVGGHVGYQFGGTLSNSYATGAVSGTNSVGGLVGFQIGGTISNAYATGAVSGSSNVGGLIGFQTGGTISNSYWDMQTSGQNNAFGLAAGSSNGIAGLTTAAFQSGGAAGLGSAFSGGANGLYPYLTSFYPNGVQAISGFAYTDSGVTKAASGANGPRYVYIDIAGKQTAVTTGANGYYYLAVANGTLSSANGGTATLAYTLAGNVTGPVAGAHLMAATGTTANVDIWGNTLIAPTTATTLSAAPTDGAALLGANGSANQTLLTAALGNDTAASGMSNLSLAGYVATGVGGFTIDQGISANGLYVRTTNGPITVSSAQTLGGPINIELLSAGALAINAPITVNGAGSVTLGYDASSLANLSFGLAGSGFAGSLTFTNADGTAATSAVAGQALSINNQAYTLLYSMADVGSITNGLSGKYALATNLDASPASYASAVVAAVFNGTLEGLGNTISNLTITGNNDNVGLIGRLGATGTIRDLGLVGGSVSGYNFVGGLVGYQDGGGTINNAYATGAVSGTFYVGGLVGIQTGGTISNAYATGAVIGNGYVGGLVGYQDSSAISNAYATGAVSGTSNVGGLVGVQDSGTISNAFSTGAVSGASNVGGLLGYQAGALSNVYATGAVIGNSYVGGLVGHQYFGSTISNAYAAGAVSGASNVGGLVGGRTGGTISHSYWDMQTSGQSSSAGGTGLTTAQMQNPFTFTDAGWDFSAVWAKPKAGGAPVLRSLNTASVYDYYVRLTGNTTAIYGDTIVSGITVDGIGAANVAVSFGAVNAGTHAYSGSNVLLNPSVGSAGDYFVDYGTGSLIISQRALTVTADALSLTYGSTPTLTYTVGGLGLVNGDTLSGALAGITSTTGVGSYAITQGTLTNGNNSNYAITYVGANASVTPRALTVTADALSRTYGDANPALTYTVGGGGLVNGDLLGGALATDADINSIAGRYAITRGSLSASANYSMTFVPGTLTVNAVINPPAGDLASTVVNSTPPGMIVTAAMLPGNFSPPSGNGSGSTVLFADPRFDGVVICNSSGCIVAPPEARP